MSKAYLKKLGLQFLVINIVFLVVLLFIDDTFTGNDGIVNGTKGFYYLSAFILFMASWETNDYLIRKAKKTKSTNEIFMHLKILTKTSLVVICLSAAIYYLGAFELETTCNIEIEDPWRVFKIDMFRAFGITLVFSIFNQFFWMSSDKKKLEISMLALKKEMMNSKYTSLKSQISPHFLFNSLNTLTSLIYEDRDLASDFVSRLASCYRYILDNTEKSLVTLDKEIQFLDSFIFMMKVRHNGAILIHTNISKTYFSKLIPTLSIQMLVENALKHNYYSKENPIIIDVSIDNNRILITNNIKRRIDSQESTQLGLKNIKKRYAFYTQEQVIIENNTRTFKVSMPLLSEMNLQKQP
ncbi:sensor histidine kinase [Tenacibaculum xiamenense]|uniref:sensor histidine kinase n=1 Tax=Tenacibaculum xiamenense TaxID=1261553 RepID=UPI0038964EF7